MRTAEYRSLCAVFGELQQRYQVRKQELRRILEAVIALKGAAFLALLKANDLTRHLTSRQRQVIGLTYSLGELKERISRTNLNALGSSGAEGEHLPSPPGLEDCRKAQEFKQREVLVVSMIDGAKKKLLQFDLLELRCRELSLSADKALEAFHHEYGIIRRRIYPFGVFSVFRRRLRMLWGSAYFTLRDMENIAALGNITGHVLKIADSPVI